MSLPGFAPSMADDAEFQEWWGKFERLGATPGAAINLMHMNSQIDISRVLSSIQAPTLVINRTEDVLIDPDASRFLTENIPGAIRYTSPGADHIPWVSAAVDGEIEAIKTFLDSLPDLDTRERVLATVLVIRPDAAASEATITRIKEQVRLHRGSDLKKHGLAYVATFEGPVRAVRCAKAIAASISRARLCVHTGEIAFDNNEMQGAAIDVATEAAEVAGAGEVVVTRIVKDLVAGSGLRFTDLADQRLEADPESQPAYRVL